MSILTPFCIILNKKEAVLKGEKLLESKYLGAELNPRRVISNIGL